MIHHGRGGWLFLTGGSNQVLRFYVEPDAFPDALVENWLERFRARTEKCAGMGVEYFHLVAPEKLTIYPEYYDGDLPFIEQVPSLRLARAAAKDGSVVNVVDYFRNQKRDYQLYWKTDTHWTFHGCFCAYQMLCSRLGIPPNDAITQGIQRGGNIVLDLGAKMEPPVKEQFVMVEFLRHARRVDANAMVIYKEQNHLENDAGLHVGSNVVFVNDNP